MGGEVNVYIRDHSRTLYKMRRWTNTLPSYLLFIGHESEIKNLDQYMANWYEMEADWEKNGPKGPFQHAMTNAYFPSPQTIKYGEYGLVFVDYVTKTIISYQNYTNIGSFIAASYWVRFDDDERKLCRAVADRDALSFTSPDLQRDVIFKVRGSGHFDGLIKKQDSYIMFFVDNSPWVIKNGEKGDMKIRDLRKEIEKILAQ